MASSSAPQKSHEAQEVQEKGLVGPSLLIFSLSKASNKAFLGSSLRSGAPAMNCWEVGWMSQASFLLDLRLPVTMIYHYKRWLPVRLPL